VIESKRYVLFKVITKRVDFWERQLWPFLWVKMHILQNNVVRNV